MRVGKYVELRLKDAPTEMLTENVSEMCARLLANPVIETYRFEVQEEP